MLPEVVRKGGDYWSLNTRNMLAVVVEGFKEFYDEFDTLREQIAGFAERIVSDEIVFERAVGGELHIDTLNAENGAFEEEVCMAQSDGTPVCITGDELAELLGEQEANDAEGHTSVSAGDIDVKTDRSQRDSDGDDDTRSTSTDETVQPTSDDKEDADDIEADDEPKDAANDGQTSIASTTKDQPIDSEAHDGRDNNDGETRKADPSDPPETNVPGSDNKTEGAQTTDHTPETVANVQDDPVGPTSDDSGNAPADANPSD